MEFVKATAADLEPVTQIEKNVMSCPWSFDNFTEALNSDHCIFLVAKDEQRVAGYVLFYLSVPEAELPDIVVDSSYRRQGVARGLLKKAIELAKSQGVADIFLEVRESNTLAKTLYNQFGFTELGIRKNFYSEPVENAICMKLSL